MQGSHLYQHTPAHIVHSRRASLVLLFLLSHFACFVGLQPIWAATWLTVGHGASCHRHKYEKWYITTQWHWKLFVCIVGAYEGKNWCLEKYTCTSAHMGDFWQPFFIKPSNVFRDSDGLGIIGYAHGFTAEWLLASKAPLYGCSEKEGLGARGTRTVPWGAKWPALTCKFFDMPEMHRKDPHL